MSALHCLVMLALLGARPSWADEGGPEERRGAETANVEDESGSVVRSPTWSRTRAVRSEAPILPDELQRMAITSLVAELLRGAPAAHVPLDAAARAEGLGLSLERAGDRLWLVEPTGPPPRGLGMVAIRLGPLPAELVLQAPHPYYDEHTGRIAGALFDAGGVRAAVIASAQRYSARGIDPTGQPAAPLQAITAAIPQGLPDALVVQLHGFGHKNSDAHGVVSTGAARSGGSLYLRAMSALAVALRPEDEEGVDLRGPKEVPLLAGMANVQSWLLADRTRFLHLELSSGVRGRLRTDEQARRRLSDALLALAAREGER